MFFGLSVKGAVTQDMVRAMADKPIIFAMANPDPEITPGGGQGGAAGLHHRHRPQRLPEPGQQRPRLPLHLPRRARRAGQSTINDAMKVAAARALALLAREDVPEEVNTAGAGKSLRFGPEYIIPNAFDPRLISRVPVAVAKAAIDSGVARKPIDDLHALRPRADRPARRHGQRAGAHQRAGARQPAQAWSSPRARRRR